MSSHLTDSTVVVPDSHEMVRLADQIEERYRHGLREGRLENRKFKRYKLATEVALAVADVHGVERGERLQGQSVNLSLLGMGLALDAPLELGVMVTVAFDMPSRPPRSVKMLAQVRNAVLTSDDRCVVGLHFHQTLSAATTGTR